MRVQKVHDMLSCIFSIGGPVEGAVATHRAGVDSYDADLPVPEMLRRRSTSD
jgi:hypothetical protein